MGFLNDRSFFGGKLHIRTLSEQEADGLFRKTDERGMVVLASANGILTSVEVAEFAGSDVRRGFHVHARFTEQLYVISGSLRMRAAEDERGDIVDVTLSPGDLVTISPGIAHGFVSLLPSLVLSMGSGSDPFEDRERAEWL